MLRLVLALLGIGALIVGSSAFSKLAQAHLDSPRWLVAALGTVAVAAGFTLLWYAIIRLRPRRRKSAG